MIRWLQDNMPKIVLAPSFIAVMVFVYGFIAWTAWVSLTRSRLMPRYEFDSFIQYERLADSPRFETAMVNLAIFGTLFIVIAMVLGLLLAILLDQKIRTEGAIRTIYLYPMALSMIVTGTAWKWILNPELGIEAAVKGWGFANFEFNWLVDPDMAIYTVVLAAVWQSSGFVMALFLAGLRSVDEEIIKAAQVDGIPLGAFIPRSLFRRWPRFSLARSSCWPTSRLKPLTSSSRLLAVALVTRPIFRPLTCMRWRFRAVTSGRRQVRPWL